MELPRVDDYLADWRLERWYKLLLSTDDRSGSKVGGYFTSVDVATATGRGQAWYGSDGTVTQVVVLTKDGKTGFLVDASAIEISNEAQLERDAKNKALAKLKPEERKLLGL